MFNLRNYNPYELSKINAEKIANNVVPSKSEYDNVMTIINTKLTQEQYQQLYLLFIINLPENKFSKTTRSIMIDLEKLSNAEFYRLENIICDFIYEHPKSNDIQNENQTIELKHDCDYSNINKELYVNENIEINTQQPSISNYLELYNIQRSLPSLKRE